MNFAVWLDSESCVRLTTTLLHFLWQGALVALGAGLVSAALRRDAARARYGLCVGALLVMAICPPLTFAWLGLPSSTGAPFGTRQASGDGSALVAAVNTNEAATPTAVSPFLSMERVAVDRIPAAMGWERAAPYGVICYLTGVTLLIGRLLLGLRGGRQLRRGARVVDDPALLAIVTQRARALGLRVTPVIAECRRVLVPTVVGVLRPMILLPLSVASGLSTEQVAGLLTHELAHIRRYDHLVNILQRVVEALLFFHPAIWLVSRRIRIEREHCCDDVVLAGGGRAVAYSETLLRMAELSLAGGGGSPAAAVALAAVDRPSLLRQRIGRMLEGPSGPRVRVTRSWVLVGVAGALAFFVVSSLHGGAGPRAVAAPAESDVPASMVGTWHFDNPAGDDEQMAVFADGRVVVLYSNGHKDDTRFVDGTIELAEYDKVKATMAMLADGSLVQTSPVAPGFVKLWRRVDAAPVLVVLQRLTASALESEVPAGMVGTWHFDNPMGDDEQMAVFADGRVVVLYSNGHKDDTQYVDGTVELAEYDKVKATMSMLADGSLVQTSPGARGLAKVWRRLDAAATLVPLLPLTAPAGAGAAVAALVADRPGTVKFQPDHFPFGTVRVGATVEASARIFTGADDPSTVNAKVAPPSFVTVRETTIRDWQGQAVVDLFFSIDTTDVGEFSSDITIDLNGRTVKIPVTVTVAPRPVSMPRVLITSSPFGRTSTGDGRSFKPLTGLVTRLHVDVHYAEALPDDLSSYSVILLAGGELCSVDKGEIARLRRFVGRGGRLILAANRFFRGTVASANKILEGSGLVMDDREPIREFTTELMAADPLTTGVERLSFFRASPIRVIDDAKAKLLVLSEADPQRGWVAVSRSKGEIVVLGQSLWWTWIGRDPTTADNARLLANLLALLPRPLL